MKEKRRDEKKLHTGFDDKLEPVHSIDINKVKSFSDMTKAMATNTTSISTYFGCVFSKISRGPFSSNSQHSPIIVNCTFYDMQYGVRIVNEPAIVINCVFSEIDNYGLYGQTQGYATCSRYCYFYNCTSGSHRYGVADDTDVVGTDPELNDPANNDFTLKATSPCLGAGANLTFAGLA